MKKSQMSASIDRAILTAREEGLSLAEIGKRVGMSRQGVHNRLKALAREGKERGDDVLVELLQRTNRLLAGVIVTIARTQTTRAEYPIEILADLGLSLREIGEAIGMTEATVNVTKSRAKAKQSTSPADAPEGTVQ